MNVCSAAAAETVDFLFSVFSCFEQGCGTFQVYVNISAAPASNCNVWVDSNTETGLVSCSPNPASGPEVTKDIIQLNWSAGDNSQKVINVTVWDDNIPEPTETYCIEMRNDVFSTCVVGTNKRFELKIADDDGFGISDLYNNNTIKIYPNVTTDNLFIEGIDNAATITIINVLSQTVASRPWQKNETVNVSDLENGCYLLILRQNEKLFTQRFIKQ